MMSKTVTDTCLWESIVRLSVNFSMRLNLYDITDSTVKLFSTIEELLLVLT